MGYKDLHEHLKALEEQNLLYRINAPINKDTEIHTLMRWQFRGGIPEDQRKAFLFENVTDARDLKFQIPVTVGALAASTAVDRTLPEVGSATAVAARGTPARPWRIAVKAISAMPSSKTKKTSVRCSKTRPAARSAARSIQSARK